MNGESYTECVGNCCNQLDNAIPPLFEMDDYSSCIQNRSNVFCNIEGTLTFSNSAQCLADYIKNLTADRRRFDRTVLHRGLCLAKDEVQNPSVLMTYYKKTIQKFNATDVSDIEIIACTDKNDAISYYDQMVFIFLVSYGALIAYATIYESMYKGAPKSSKIEFLKKFSLVHNWKQRTSESKNVDFQRLLSMQGLRFFLMLSIIFVHVLSVYSLSFVSNPLQYESITSYIFIPVMMFIVLPFFVMSSWLLTLQVYKHIEKNGALSIKDVGIIVLNRYLRLAVTVGVVIFTLLSTWPTRYRGPLTFTALHFNSVACKKHWLRALLFVGNFNYALDICNSVSWHLSADFQVYVINLIMLYIKFKFNFKGIIFYPIIMLGSCLLHGLIVYPHGHEIMYTVNLRHFEEHVFKNSLEWVVYYAATHSVWACSIIGLIMGEVYYKIKNKSIENNTYITILWTILFVGLPNLALYLGTVQTDGIKAAFLASIVKPLFNLGFGLGILGMSLNIGGFLKKIFEYKYFVLLGNFTYCAYLIHMLPLVIMQSLKGWPWYMTAYELFRDYIVLNLITWPLGILLSLGLEEPGIAIQKEILPQIKRKNVEEVIREKVQ